MKNFPSIDKSRASCTTASNVSTEISKISIIVLSLTACIMGCWAVASMIAGALNSGGPIGLVVNLFTAING